MTWLQPWAWVGLVAIALPIAIHLLGSGRSPRQPFPTLRFLETTRLHPTRRTRIHDKLLLLLRVAIFIFAVLALAHPLINSAERKDAYAGSLARLVIVDTSASMHSLSDAGSLLDSARRVAETLEREANAGLTLESAAPGKALAGAAGWLSLHQQRREIVVISDFQSGAVSEFELDGVPNDVGLRFVRVGSAVIEQPVETVHQLDGRRVQAIISHSDSAHRTRSEVRWTSAPGDSRSYRVDVLAGDEGATATAIATRAADAMNAIRITGTALASPDTAQVRAVTIVTASYGERDALMLTARMPSEAWMLQSVLALRGDALLQELAANIVADSEIFPQAGIAPIARARNGHAIVNAAEAEINGESRLLLFTHANTGVEIIASVIAALRSSVESHTSYAELDPARLADSTIARWNREPSSEPRVSATDASAASTESDGRWLWLVVLVLLTAESLLRRRTRQSAVLEQ